MKTKLLRKLRQRSRSVILLQKNNVVIEYVDKIDGSINWATLKSRTREDAKNKATELRREYILNIVKNKRHGI